MAAIQYVGRNYSEEGTSEEVPINLLALYVSIVQRSLVAKTPRVMLSTFQFANKPSVDAMQTWVNKEMEDMHIARTLQRWVVDALFSIGIIKVALATPSDAAKYQWNLQGGQPFAMPVDLDDFVYDMHARDWDEVSFIGHRYRAALDTIRDSKLYNKARKNLVASYDPLYNEEGDERIDVIGRTTYGAANTEEFEEMVDLWEVYLPRHRQVVTLASDNAGNPDPSGGDEDALRVQRWLGPEAGPYHILGFQQVPGNIMPKAPIQDLYDLHCTANNLYRKLCRQAQNLKKVLCYGGTAEADGERFRTANDGDVVRCDHPDQVKEIVMRQPDQQLMAMFLDCVQRFSVMAGNLEMLGGLSPQSKTATQDKLLNANASGTMASMQETVTTAVAKVIKALCWYWKHDPLSIQKSTFSVPGLPEASIVRSVTPQQRRQIPWDEMDIKVDPYSYQMQTPQGRLQQLQQVVQTTVIPMMQLLQQQGIMFDMHAYLKKMGAYLDCPDITEILTIATPPETQTQSGGQPPTQPAQTERTYNRVSMPGTHTARRHHEHDERLARDQPRRQPRTNRRPAMIDRMVYRSKRWTFFLGGCEVTETEYRSVYPKREAVGSHDVSSFVQFKPLASDAMAVHPKQVKEAREDAIKKGVPVDFLEDGRPVFTSRKQRADYLKAYGFHDRDACYSDPAPGSYRGERPDPVDPAKELCEALGGRITKEGTERMIQEILEGSR